jgi:hypothetical protein
MAKARRNARYHTVTLTVFGVVPVQHGVQCPVKTCSVDWHVDWHVSGCFLFSRFFSEDAPHDPVALLA